MRILAVKFLNLNSLRGEHEIRFDQPPFSESGLFAITGPTGAGKTTILDAITVALYGRVHRHDRNPEEMMSRHTAESFAEVEFEVKGHSYRSKWSRRRSRGKADGALQPEQMELAEIETGRFIGGSTATAIKQAITELCGLDYSQFLRSVMLSQGDFTRFLKASDNERSELLERITDTAIYSEISILVFTKQREEKDKLDTLRLKLQDTVILSDEERQVHDAHRREQQQEEKKIKTAQIVITKQVAWLKEIRLLRESQVDQENELVEKQREELKEAPQLARLKRHQELQVLRSPLAGIETLEIQAAAMEKELGTLKQALPGFLEQAKVAEGGFKEADEKLKQTTKELKSAEPVWERVTLLDAGIVGAHEQVQNLWQSKEDTKHLVNNLIETQEKKAVRKTTLSVALQNTDCWLAEHTSDQEITSQLPVLQQLYQNLHQAVVLLTNVSEELETSLQEKRTEEQAYGQTKIRVEQVSVLLNEQEQEVQAALDELESGRHDASLEHLEQDARQLPLIIQYCEQQHRLALGYQQNQVDRATLKSSVHQQKQILEQKNSARITLDKARDAATLHLVDLRLLVEAQQRIQKYDADRINLEAGKPCPLCGAIHHPYAEGQLQSAFSEAELKRNAQEALANNLAKDCQQAALEINTITERLSASEKETAAMVQLTDKLVNEFALNNAYLPKPLDISKAEPIKILWNKKQKDFLEVNISLKKLKAADEKLSETRQIVLQSRENLTELQNQLKVRSERINNMTTSIRRMEKQLNQAKKDHDGKVGEIAQLLKNFGLEFESGQYTTLENQLIQRSQDFQKSAHSKQQLELEQNTISTELKALVEQLAIRKKEAAQKGKDYTLQHSNLEELLKVRHLLFGDKNVSIERNEFMLRLESQQNNFEYTRNLFQQQKQKLEINEARLITEIQRNTDREKQLKTLNEEFLKKLADKGIPNRQTLIDAFLTEEEEKRLVGRQNELHTRINVLKALIKKTEQELKTLEEQNKTSAAEPDLLEQQEQLHQSLSSLNQEIGRLIKVLEDDDQMREKFAGIATQIELQKSEFKRWNDLSSLIGSADGKKFSRFAQGLTLARLTDLANVHLDKLSDRYRILKSSENDLELLIVDGYQADVVRPITTLSGGESFLVSLALALGLSDLASHKVQINSLFIDEGFGTLDAETLDVAISALENLQASGKTIGIISHVETLKERIGTQIQLSKQAGGLSRIKVTAYSNELFDS